MCCRNRAVQHLSWMRLQINSPTTKWINNSLDHETMEATFLSCSDNCFRISQNSSSGTEVHQFNHPLSTMDKLASSVASGGGCQCRHSRSPPWDRQSPCLLELVASSLLLAEAVAPDRIPLHGNLFFPPLALVAGKLLALGEGSEWTNSTWPPPHHDWPTPHHPSPLWISFYNQA